MCVCVCVPFQESSSLLKNLPQESCVHNHTYTGLLCIHICSPTSSMKTCRLASVLLLIDGLTFCWGLMIKQKFDHLLCQSGEIEREYLNFYRKSCRKLVFKPVLFSSKDPDVSGSVRSILQRITVAKST